MQIPGLPPADSIHLENAGNTFFVKSMLAKTYDAQTTMPKNRATPQTRGVFNLHQF
jgi:hypothetical protein